MKYPTKRNLVDLGGSYSITLPMDWIDENRLRKKTKTEKKYIMVNKLGNSLLINPITVEMNKRAFLDVTGYSTHTKKLIGAAYKWGFDEITIKYSTTEESDQINEISSNQLLNFKKKKQDFSKKIITYVNTATGTKEFKSSIETIFDSMLQMCDEIINASELEDDEFFDRLLAFKTLDDTIDESADYIRRIINLGFDIGFYRNGPLYTVIEQLEKVADNLKELCNVLVSKKIRISKEMVKKLKDFKVKLKLYFDLFNNDYDRDNFLACVNLKPSPFPDTVEGILDLSLETLKNLNGPILQLHIHEFDMDL